MRTLSCGEHALLAEFENLAQVMTLYGALSVSRPAGVIDIIPAARTLLVRFDPELTDRARICSWVADTTSIVDNTDPRAGTVVVPVRYDGDDLASVAAACGLSTTRVVELHTATIYTVAFCGFAPGFGYLTGLPDALKVPRRSSPRTRVPAGSVALADEFTAVYPHATPGGWKLIGRTDLTVFDVDREPPALLTPGTRVRFVEAGR